MSLIQGSFRRVITLLIIALVLVLTSVTPNISRADSSNDGRINKVIWVNSWGAIAVYCKDQSGVAGSYHGGGIEVLNSTGQSMLYVPESGIIAAQTTADKTNKPVAIKSGKLYTIYALPNQYFQINSVPDAEGKTFLGTWHGCDPVNYPSGSSSCLKSLEATSSLVSVTFVNKEAFTVNVFWVDYACHEVFYNSLGSSQSYVQLTYVTHPWRIRRASDGALLKEFVVGSTSPITVTVP